MREVLARLAAAVEDCTSAAVWARSDQDLVDALVTVHTAGQQLAGVCARLVRELDGRGVPAAEHAVSTRVWLRDRLRIGVHAAKRIIELGEELDRRPALDAALGDGVVGVEQVQVIAGALADLPDTVDPGTVGKAEAVLVEMAGRFEPAALRLLGRRILSHVDPEAGEAADAAALAREQARAHQRRTLALAPAGQGRVRLTGWLDAEAAATINAALEPLCRPLPEDTRTCGQRRADALTEVCRLALRTESLPANGGDRPHVVVTVPYQLLQAQLGVAQLGVAQLDTGELLTAEQARRLACDAQILPAVLGSDGQVLDVGRARRLFTGPIRRALILRDGGCAFPGCDRPATWTDAHHIRSWLDGGPTSVDNGVLLCGHHHRVIHTEDWAVRIGPDGIPEFIPPAYVDPARTPRHNIYHHPERHQPAAHDRQVGPPPQSSDQQSSGQQLFSRQPPKPPTSGGRLPDQRPPDQRPPDQRPPDQRPAGQQSPRHRPPNHRSSGQQQSAQRQPDQRHRYHRRI